MCDFHFSKRNYQINGSCKQSPDSPSTFKCLCVESRDIFIFDTYDVQINGSNSSYGLEVLESYTVEPSKVGE